MLFILFYSGYQLRVYPWFDWVNILAVYLSGWGIWQDSRLKSSNRLLQLFPGENNFLLTFPISMLSHPLHLPDTIPTPTETKGQPLILRNRHWFSVVFFNYIRDRFQKNVIERFMETQKFYLIITLAVIQTFQPIKFLFKAFRLQFRVLNPSSIITKLMGVKLRKIHSYESGAT